MDASQLPLTYAAAGVDIQAGERAVQLIRQAGGLPVLAHPLTVDNYESTIVELKAAGLEGIEVYYNSYSADEISGLAELATRHDLIATGGSDYHGLDAVNETMMGGVDVPIASVERLIARAEQLRQENKVASHRQS